MNQHKKGDTRTCISAIIDCGQLSEMADIVESNIPITSAPQTYRRTQRRSCRQTPWRAVVDSISPWLVYRSQLWVITFKCQKWARTMETEWELLKTGAYHRKQMQTVEKEAGIFRERPSKYGSAASTNRPRLGPCARACWRPEPGPRPLRASCVGLTWPGPAHHYLCCRNLDISECMNRDDS